MKIINGVIYKAKRGTRYNREFDCYTPAIPGGGKVDSKVCSVVDCWPCNEEGQIYDDVSPIPVLTKHLSEVVGVMGEIV